MRSLLGKVSVAEALSESRPYPYGKKGVGGPYQYGPGGVGGSRGYERRVGVRRASSFRTRMVTLVSRAGTRIQWSVKMPFRWMIARGM